MFGEVFREKSQGGQVVVLAEQIMLWRRQAIALGRSTQHLEKIDLFVEKAKEKLMGKVSIPIRDCGAMLIDGREFTNLAFELILKNEADKKP